MGAKTGPLRPPKQPLVSSLRLGVGPGTPFPHGGPGRPTPTCRPGPRPPADIQPSAYLAPPQPSRLLEGEGTGRGREKARGEEGAQAGERGASIPGGAEAGPALGEAGMVKGRPARPLCHGRGPWLWCSWVWKRQGLRGERGGTEEHKTDPEPGPGLQAPSWPGLLRSHFPFKCWNPSEVSLSIKWHGLCPGSVPSPGWAFALSACSSQTRPPAHTGA